VTDARGVILDMDGVLVDSYHAHLESWRRLAREISARVTEQQFAATFGRTSRDIIRELFDRTDDAEIAELDARKEALYRELITGHVPAMPGARDLVNALHAAGFRLAVGSSGPPENVNLVCREMELDAYIDAKVTGHDVTRGKPDPQVFQRAAQRLSLLPAHCVVIEDAPAGIEAAHRAGMRAIALVGSHGADALSHADRAVTSLTELNPQIINTMLQD